MTAFMKKQSLSYLYALITVALWSTVATAFKIALRDCNNIQVLLIANSVSLMVFFVMLLMQGNMRQLKNETSRSIALSVLQGFLNPFAYYLILFKAYSMLPAQVAQPANFIWPIVLMLLSIPLLKQPFRLINALALLISFIGLFVLSTQGNLSSFHIEQPAGLGMALLTSLIWSLYWIFNLRDSRMDLIKLFLSFLFSEVFIVTLSAFTGDLSVIWAKPWLPSVYIGLFEMGITFVCWMKALQLSDSTGKVSNLIYLTPFISIFIIHTVLHERLHYTSILGLCLIVSGIIIGRIKKKPLETRKV
jgi:drug/metabolite transporter (DMT)-like permease